MNKKVNHLYLIDEHGRSSSFGIGAYMILLENLYLNFEKITIVDLNAPEDGFTIEKKDNHRYICFPLLSNNRKNYYKRCYYSLALYSDLSEINVVHITSFNCLELAFLLKKRLNFKVVFTWHYTHWKEWIKTSDLLFLLNMSESELAVQPEVEKIKRKRVEESGRMLKDYDKIITVCQESYDELQQVYGLSATQLALIHNPVKPLKGRNDYVAPDKKNIICVGRIDHNKNVELLVEAFIELRKKRDDIRLLIVGGGVYDNAISRIGLNYQDICFTGMLNKEQLEEVYQNAHVGVTLSWHEEGPLVALEMMQHGIPVIGSRTGILPELIEDGRNGYLVDLVWRQNDFNIQPVVERLEAVLSAPNYMQMRQYAIDSVDERFSYELFKEKMTRLYEELLNRD